MAPYDWGLEHGQDFPLGIPTLTEARYPVYDGIGPMTRFDMCPEPEVDGFESAWKWYLKLNKAYKKVGKFLDGAGLDSAWAWDMVMEYDKYRERRRKWTTWIDDLDEQMNKRCLEANDEWFVGEVTDRLENFDDDVRYRVVEMVEELETNSPIIGYIVDTYTLSRDILRKNSVKLASRADEFRAKYGDKVSLEDEYRMVIYGNVL
jgi:hypothetical protein